MRRPDEFWMKTLIKKKEELDSVLSDIACCRKHLSHLTSEESVELYDLAEQRLKEIKLNKIELLDQITRESNELGLYDE